MLERGNWERQIFGTANDVSPEHEGAGSTMEGTLFLDEVADLAPDVQGQVLRLVEDRQFRSARYGRDITFRGRIVAATNSGLHARMVEGRFREDLYFRLRVLELPVPPLRERRVDILPFAHQFLASSTQKLSASCKGFTSTAEDDLVGHSWPGNLRELRNRIDRGVAVSSHQTKLASADLFPERTLAVGGSPERVATLSEARAEAERRQIRAALMDTGGEIGRAAALLGVSRTTLWEKMRRLNLPQAAAQCRNRWRAFQLIKGRGTRS